MRADRWGVLGGRLSLVAFVLVGAAYAADTTPHEANPTTRGSSLFNPKPKKLAKTLEQDIADGTFYDEVRGAKVFNVGAAHPIDFDAAPGSGCTKVTVRMIPAKDVHNLVHKYDNSKSDLDERGYLLAAIENTSSTCQTAQLSIPPLGVLYWIARKHGGAYESQLIGPNHGVITVRPPSFKHCPLEHDADHDAVNHYPHGGVCDSTFRHSSPGRNTAPFLNDEVIWVSCDLGCCYADDLPALLRLTPTQELKGAK